MWSVWHRQIYLSQGRHEVFSDKDLLPQEKNSDGYNFGRNKSGHLLSLSGKIPMHCS
jgi:hypothetical protein